MKAKKKKKEKVTGRQVIWMLFVSLIVYAMTMLIFELAFEQWVHFYKSWMGW